MIKPENRNCFEFFRDCTKDFGVYDVSESFGNLISRKKFMRDIEAIAGFLDSKNIKRGEQYLQLLRYGLLHRKLQSSALYLGEKL